MPKLMFKPKWFKTDRDLLEGDLVYFVKRDGALDNKWTIGMVESVDRGRDGIIRKATIKYCNSSEQKLSLRKGDRQDDSTFPRYTERAVRKLVKIFSLEETSLAEDLAELDKRHSGGGEQAEGTDDVRQEDAGDGPAANTRLKARCKVCCCYAHCEFKFHYPSSVKMKELPYAINKEKMSMEALYNLENIQKPDREVNDMAGLLNSVSCDVSSLFGN